MVRAEGELAAQVEALLADAERLDAAEDAAYGLDRRGDEPPAELGRREGRARGDPQREGGVRLARLPRELPLL